MNASKFMDKQIMELSGSSQPPDKFFDLISPQEEHPISTAAGGDIKKEEQHQEPEILPSYDFHPIGSFSPPTSSGGGIGGAWPTWGSGDSKLASLNLKNAGTTPEPHGFAKVGHEKEKNSYDNVIGSDIDHIVKKHTDKLMDAMEFISSKLLQLDNRTHHLENSLAEIKMAIANNNGSTEGRLSQLENILREVHSGVQVLQDKQDVVEAQLHLAQLNAPKGELQYSESSKTEQHELHQQIPPPQQLIQQSYQHTVPLAQPIMLPSASVPNTSLPVQPNAPLPIPPVPQSQVPSVPSLPRDPYFPSAAPPVEGPSKPFQVTAQQQQATAPPPPLPQTYQSSQLPQYLQPPPSHQLVNPSPQSLTIPPHSEESVHVPPPQNYPPSIRQPAPFPQHSPSQQFYGPNSSTYEPPTSKQGPGLPSFSSSYGPPGPNYSDSYVHTGFASNQSNSAMKPLPFASSVPAGGSSNYPRLPVARVLPQAAPTGSGSGGSPGARVPIDDVVERVTTMGFSKDQVRATVRKLTENGQSVDLNVVLDKLMNDGDIQPQKGWFGR